MEASHRNGLATLAAAYGVPRDLSAVGAAIYGRSGEAGEADRAPQEEHRIATRSPLGTAWRQLERSLDDDIDTGLAAA